MQKHQSGFTILEILVALTVLGIGMLGIMALFPVATKRVNETVADSQASAMAESFHQSLVVGFHKKEGQHVIFRHAGLGENCDSASGDKKEECYRFKVPEPPNSNPISTKEIPNGDGTADDPHGQYFWKSSPGTDDWDSPTSEENLSNLIEDVKSSDPSMDLDRYRVSVKVDRFASESLFRVQIAVYRNYKNIKDAGPNCGSGSPCIRHPNLVKEYRAMIAGGG